MAPPTRVEIDAEKFRRNQLTIGPHIRGVHPQRQVFKIVHQEHGSIANTLYRAVGQAYFGTTGGHATWLKALVDDWIRFIFYGLPTTNYRPRRLLYQSYNRQLEARHLPTLDQQFYVGKRPEPYEICQCIGDLIGCELVILESRGLKRLEIRTRGNHQGRQIFLLYSWYLGRWDLLMPEDVDYHWPGEFRYSGHVHDRRLLQTTQSHQTGAPSSPGLKSYDQHVRDRASVEGRHTRRTRMGADFPAPPIEGEVPIVRRLRTGKF